MAIVSTKRKFIDFAKNTTYFCLSKKKINGEIGKYALIAL